MVPTTAVNSATASLAPASPPGAQANNDPEKVRDAARQFESLLLGQILKSMRDSEGGWMGTDEDDASSSAMEYAQEMFAQALASGGGLGIARMVERGLIPAGKG
jgi:peptidoglycan hydrolase FlgJ